MLGSGTNSAPGTGLTKLKAETFLIEVQDQTSLHGVSDLLSEYGGTLGFPTHAIAPVPTKELPVIEGHFLVQNWPPEWDRAYHDRNFADFDPIPRAATLTARPITVRDIVAGKAGFVPDPRAQQLIDFATVLNCAEGLLVPIFGPHGYRAIVCYAGPGPAPDTRARALLHIWAIYAHDRIRDLCLSEKDTPAKLTPRELAVLGCARDGLTDGEASQQLGIAVRTVRFHHSNLRAKLGATSRNQAVALATKLNLFDG